MKTVRQDYEKNFKCIADKCPETCCSGWLIMVDEDSLESIYNGMIFGYAAMCVFGPLMIDRICRLRALDREEFTIKDFEEVVYKYSRETEHSEENIDILLEYFDSQCP